MSAAANGRRFVCPECGSEHERQRILCSPPALTFVGEIETQPWLGVLEVIVCDGCGYHVPAHLGERWDGLTESTAEDEWRRTYRDGAPRESMS